MNLLNCRQLTILIAFLLMSCQGGGGGHEPMVNEATFVSVPGGSFRMGSNGPEDNEVPAHSVDVPPFEIMREEVTVEAYQQCVNAGSCPAPDTGVNVEGCNYGVSSRERHPVNCITWDDAVAYAAWANARLPTEAEWEYIARSRGRNIRYPWGDAEPSCAYANMGGYVAAEDGCGRGTTAPVCSYRNGNSDAPDEICDLAGNVAEFVLDDFHDRYACPEASDTGIGPSEWLNCPDQVAAPDNGTAWVDSPPSELKVIRGGNYKDVAKYLRTTARIPAPGSTRGPGLGFRLAR